MDLDLTGKTIEERFMNSITREIVLKRNFKKYVPELDKLLVNPFYLGENIEFAKNHSEFSELKDIKGDLITISNHKNFDAKKGEGIIYRIVPYNHCGHAEECAENINKIFNV